MINVINLRSNNSHYNKKKKILNVASFFFHCTGELNAKELYTFTEQKITSYIYLLIYYLHFFREVFLSIFLSALRKL